MSTENDQEKAPKFPCPAFIVRLMPDNSFTDALSVQACTALRMDKNGFAVCEVRVGSAVEQRFVLVSDLASSERRALVKITHLLHALAARPLQHEVAGKTAAGAALNSPAASGVEAKIPAAVMDAAAG